MEIVNLARGKGKTMRLLYLSEYYQIPILCPTIRHKDNLIKQAKNFDINIPEPIVYSIDHNDSNSKPYPIDCLIDDFENLFRIMILEKGFKPHICTCSIDEYNNRNKKMS